MSGKHGVTSIKSVMSLGKLGVISVIQAIKKDGFQARDIVAPLGSPTFQNAMASAIDDFALVLPEWGDLDIWDGIEIGKHAHSCWIDIKTELNVAALEMKRRMAA